MIAEMRGVAFVHGWGSESQLFWLRDPSLISEIYGDAKKNQTNRQKNTKTSEKSEKKRVRLLFGEDYLIDSDWLIVFRWVVQQASRFEVVLFPIWGRASSSPPPKRSRPPDVFSERCPAIRWIAWWFGEMTWIWNNLNSNTGWWFFKYFYFHPEPWGNDEIWLIFIKWVETTN